MGVLVGMFPAFSFLGLVVDAVLLLLRRASFLFSCVIIISHCLLFLEVWWLILPLYHWYLKNLWYGPGCGSHHCNKLSEYSQLQVFKHLSISISLSYAHWWTISKKCRYAWISLKSTCVAVSFDMVGKCYSMVTVYKYGHKALMRLAHLYSRKSYFWHILDWLHHPRQHWSLSPPSYCHRLQQFQSIFIVKHSQPH